ncbi:GSCOCG00007062001-RA-CDS [Cotesia congregata]|nr:GSCOCG00007062001-RA-CDS [Cotesia congregata]
MIPVVGSSRNNTEGLLKSSNATSNRFFCPPDKRPHNVSLPLIFINYYLTAKILSFYELHCIIKIKTYVNPAKTFSKVDLPAPDGPIIAVSSPARNSPLTP